MGANHPFNGQDYQSLDIVPKSLSPQRQDIHKASFNYKKILQQKIIEQPKPKYIRDNLEVNDILNGDGMGDWSPTGSANRND